jgi:hypothetical protein
VIGPVATPVKQLDGSKYASVNCGPTSAAMAIAHASRNRIVPTPSEMRERGDMGTGATGFAELKRAVATFGPDFAAIGLEAPKLIRLGYIGVDELRTTLIDPSAFHIVAVKYKPIHGTPYDGCPTFDGAHFVTAQRIYVPRGAEYFHRLRKWELPRWPADRLMEHGSTLDEDPLADGRRPSIPQAAQLWPLGLLVRMADQFNDAAPYDGKFPVAVIYRAKEIAA